MTPTGPSVECHEVLDFISVVLVYLCFQRLVGILLVTRLAYFIISNADDRGISMVVMHFEDGFGSITANPHYAIFTFLYYRCKVWLVAHSGRM